MTDTTLWAVHALGMDDLFPCASRRLAVRNATWMNLALARSIEQYDDANYPLVYNVPVEWPGTAAAHAAGLDEENNDARWSDPNADVIGDLARHAYAGWEDGQPGPCEHTPRPPQPASTKPEA